MSRRYVNSILGTIDPNDEADLDRIIELPAWSLLSEVEGFDWASSKKAVQESLALRLSFARSCLGNDPEVGAKCTWDIWRVMPQNGTVTRTWRARTKSYARAIYIPSDDIALLTGGTLPKDLRSFLQTAVSHDGSDPRLYSWMYQRKVITGSRFSDEAREFWQKCLRAEGPYKQLYFEALQQISYRGERS